MLKYQKTFLPLMRMRQKKNKIKSRNIKDDFEVLNFLQNENLRIRKVLDIFERKIPYRLEYSQIINIYDDIREKKSRIKSQVVEILIEEDSSFLKQFSRTFNTAFSKFHVS